jgi:ABC-type bacteriocin/lantibiotic exporter with double-glycine peptidase domain
MQFNAVISGKIAHKITLKTLDSTIFEQRNIKTSDLFLRVNLDSIEVADVITKLFYQLPLDIVRYLGFLTVVYIFDGFTALLVLSGLPVYALKSWFYSIASTDVQLQREQTDIAFTQKTNEVLLSLKNIKAYGAERFEYDKFLKLWRNRSVANRRLRVISFFSTLTNFAAIRSFQVLAVGILGYKVMHGGLSVGEFVAISSLLPNVEDPLRRLSMAYSEFKVGLVSLHRVNDILSKDIKPFDQRTSVVKTDIKRGEISIHDVSVLHNNNVAAIKKISLVFKNYSATAIVGQSGSGKSTLMNLILGFEKPVSGVIQIDGADIQEYPNELLRSRIGVVFEANPVFSGTIRENIIYNHDGITDDDLIEASKMAAAHDSIMQLPRQYETYVEQSGWNLSSGLLQRIALARALALKPKILILDDAISSIDSEYGLLIQSALQECKKRMTVILVTNQLSHVKWFDQIVVLEQGQVAEVGGFSDLLKRRGVFSRLYYLQNSGFTEFKRRLEVEFQRRTRYGHEISVVAARVVNLPGELMILGGSARVQVMKDIECFIRGEIRIMDFCSVFGEDKILIALSDTLESGAQQFIQIIQKKVRNKLFHHRGSQFKVELMAEILPIQKEALINSDLLYIEALKRLEEVQVA